MKPGNLWRLRSFVALLACLAMVAAACGDDAGEDVTTTAGTVAPTTTAAPPETTAAPEPEPTRLVFAVPPPEQGESNNPNRDIQPNDEYQLKPMYENLVGVDPLTAAWIPMLAESWELNDAGDQLTFRLREGIQFHNGFGKMTAEDVVFSLTDLIDPPGAVSGVAEAVRNAVGEFEIVDNYTVIFHVTENLSFAFFEGISYGAAGAVIKSKADWDSRGGGSPASPGLDEAPLAGTGPYQFVERNPGQNVVFEKVPYDHWRQNGDFDEIEYRFIGEEATRISSLLAGEVQMTSLSQELGDEAEAQGMQVIKSALPGRRYGLALVGCYYLEPSIPGEKSAEVFTSGERLYPDSPWCNKDIRIAANKAIDRQALNDAFYGGEAETAIMWYWLPEQTDSWNPDWEARFGEHIGYDPDGAGAILDGLGAPVSIQVIAKNDLSEAVGTMLADAGFDVELVSMDGGQYSAAREAREFDRMVEFDDTASENVTGFEPAGYCNQDSARPVCMLDWDTQYEAILIELDPVKQAALWRDFGDVVFENAPHVPLLRTFSETVVDPNVVCGYNYPGANMSAPFSFVEYIESC